jgi:hypothetical protein
MQTTVNRPYYAYSALVAIAAAALLLCASASAETIEGGGRRIALVIGNADYEFAPLRNPVNDARAMTAALKSLGFTVTSLENSSQAAMKKAIDDFGETLHAAGKNTVGLFYYSGHGMQVRGRNYIIPVGSNIRSEKQVEYESVDVARALEAMEDAGNSLNIVVLDACRDNPFSRNSRAAAGGLAMLDAAAGTLIAYATSPGRTAADGSGSNGLYTGQLVRHMRTPGLKLEEVFKRVRNDVERASEGKQVPWESSSLRGDFYFSGDSKQVAAVSPGAPSRMLDAEEVEWKAMEDSGRAEDFEDYLERYPHGRFELAAKVRIHQLKERSGAVAPDVAALTLTSVPQGATVVIDGTVYGTTPMELSNLDPRVHTIELRLFAHREWKEEILLLGGKRLSLSPALVPLRLASLDARSLAPDVEIFLNDKSRGNGGQIIDGIEPGSYTVEVHQPRMRPWKDVVNLQVGEPYNLFVPVSRPFNLAVFPAHMSGNYANYVDRAYGTLTSAEWALRGVSEAVVRETQFSLRYTYYDGFSIPKNVLDDVRRESWKGLIFSEVNTAFLRKKATELDVDAILLAVVTFPGNTGTIDIFVYDPKLDRLHRAHGTWRSGNTTGRTKEVTSEALNTFLEVRTAAR